MVIHDETIGSVNSLNLSDNDLGREFFVLSFHQEHDYGKIIHDGHEYVCFENVIKNTISNITRYFYVSRMFFRTLSSISNYNLFMSEYAYKEDLEITFKDELEYKFRDKWIFRTKEELLDSETILRTKFEQNL